MDEAGDEGEGAAQFDEVGDAVLEVVEGVEGGHARGEGAALEAFACDLVKEFECGLDMRLLEPAQHLRH